MNVGLHIERLILDGVPLNGRQSTALKNALERELSHLLERRGLDTVGDVALSHLRVADIQLSPGSPPAQWGRQIARTLHAGMTGAPANRDQSKNLNGGSQSSSTPRPSAAE